MINLFNLFLLSSAFYSSSASQYTLIYSEFCNSTFSDSNIFGWSFSSVIFGTKTSDCGTYHLFGGIGIFSNENITKTFTNLLPHYRLNVSYNLMAIDLTATLYLSMTFDWTDVSFNYAYLQSNVPVCGTFLETEYIIQIFYDFEHHSNSLTMSLISQTLQGNSFGIYQFKITALLCDASCAICAGPTAQNCSSCYPNASLVSLGGLSKCVCNSQYFYQESIPCTDSPCSQCLPCDSVCNQCTGPTSNDCISCAQKVYNGACMAACPFNKYSSASNASVCVDFCGTNEYVDANYQSCAACDSTCLTCSGPLDSNCTSCPSSHFFYNGACYLICPLGVWGNINSGVCQEACATIEYPDTTDRICKTCHSSCRTCDSFGNSNCTSCASPLIYFSGSCVSVCPNSYYCNYSTNICTMDCGIGYYGDPFDHLCKACDLSCLTCDGPNSCILCNTSSYFYNSRCYSRCPSPYWADNQICVNDCGQGNFGDPSDRKCKVCDTSCQTCNGGTSSSCLTCPSNLFFQDGNCVDECGESYWLDFSTKKCIKCDSSCKSCVEKTQYNCTSCLAPLLLQEGQCVSKCTQGFFMDAISYSCMKCDTSCLDCKGGSFMDCLSCRDQSQYLESNVCVTQCAGNLLQNDDLMICDLCSVNNCFECNVKYNICKICLGNFSLHKQGFCIKNLNVTGNLTHEKEQQQSYILNFDQNISLTSDEIGKFINISFQDLKSDSYNYAITMINGTNYFINFEFIVNVTKEMIFSLFLDPAFLSAKYPNYELTETQFSGTIQKYLICPSSYWPQESTFSCLTKITFNPLLVLTLDPLEIKLRLTNTVSTVIDADYKNAICNEIYAHHKISFEPRIPAFQNYTLRLGNSPDPYTLLFSFSLSFTESVIGNNYFKVDFNLSDGNSFLLTQLEVRQNMMDFYLLDELTQTKINKSASVASNGALASQIATYMNAFLHSDSSFAFRTLMMIEYIYILRFIKINYPANAAEMFKNKIELTKVFLTSHIEVDPLERKIFSDFLDLYNVDPYFLNNYGETMINFSMVFCTTFIINKFLFFLNSKYGESKKKAFFRFISLIHKTLVWSFFIMYVSNNYLNLCFFAALNFVYMPIRSFQGILNFIFGSLAFIFSISFLFATFFLIRKIRIFFKTREKNHKISTVYTEGKILGENESPGVNLSPRKILDAENHLFLNKVTDFALPDVSSPHKISERIGPFNCKESSNDHERNNHYEMTHKKSIFSNANNPLEVSLENIHDKTVKKIQKNADIQSHSSSKSIILKQNSENLIDNYNIIHNDFKQNTSLSHFLVCFDLARYLFIGIVVAFGHKNYVPVLPLLLIVNTLFLFYLLICFPFKEKSKNLLTILTEFANVTATVGACLIGLWDHNGHYDALDRLNAGWLIVFAQIALISTIILSIIFPLLGSLYESTKKCIIRLKKRHKNSKVWNFPQNKEVISQETHEKRAEKGNLENHQKDNNLRPPFKVASTKFGKTEKKKSSHPERRSSWRVSGESQDETKKFTNNKKRRSTLIENIENKPNESYQGLFTKPHRINLNQGTFVNSLDSNSRTSILVTITKEK